MVHFRKEINTLLGVNKNASVICRISSCGVLVTRQRDGNPGTLWLGMQNGAAITGNSVEVPQNITQNHHVSQQPHFWVYTPKNQKQGHREILVCPCPWQHYL